MIVPMKKVFLATRDEHREELLALLGAAGALHVEPVDPAVAAQEEQVRQRLALLDRVPTHLADILPVPAAVGEDPDPDPVAIAHEIEKLANRLTEHQNVLHVLRREIEDFGPWGDVPWRDLDRLAEAGCRLVVLRGPAAALDDLPCACAVELERRGTKLLLAAVNPPETLPEGVSVLERPELDRPTLRSEVEAIERQNELDRDRLAALAVHAPAIATHREALARESELDCVRRSGYEDEAMYAVQGWVPADRLTALEASLQGAGFAAGFVARDPLETESPPTAVRYPRFVRPIKGLFDMLGTVAGYEEYDVGVPFILALPLFSAMLIGDAGYGLVMCLLAFGMRRKIVGAMGKPTANLAALLAIATVIWGVATNSFFGYGVFFTAAEGADPWWIVVSTDQGPRDTLSRISLYIAAVHLSLAWLWRSVRLFPSQKFLGPLGWALVVWGMLGLVLNLLIRDPFGWQTPWPYLLIGGVALALLFESDDANPLKRLGKGLAAFPLEILAKFSDEISYVRLMAVGLASAVLAGAFNELAARTGVFQPVVFVLGHGLNFALCMIAVFAHGVRLNMLEFSNNLGMEWKGRAYNPFTAPSADHPEPS